jgi:hypothetical protein
LKDRDKYLRLTHRSIQSYGQSKLLIEAHNEPSRGQGTSESADLWLRLYQLDMPADRSLRLGVSCQNVAPTDVEVNLYLKFSNDSEPRLLLVDKVHKEYTIPIFSVTVGTPSDAEEVARLHEVGVHLRGFSGEGSAPVLEVSTIQITSFEDHKFGRNCAINHVRIESRGQDENAHSRVCWSYTEEYDKMQRGSPYSDITGPFSYFRVTVDNVQIGISYALEHIVNQHILDDRAGKEVKVEVTGVGFDGRTLASTTSTLRV